MKENVLRGLKRASWLFAAIVGVTTIIVMSVEGWDWDYPEGYGYLFPTIAFTVIAFALFRMAIWVIKGFARTDNKNIDSK